MTAEEEGMIAGMITEVHDQREGTEVLVRKDRIRALGQKVIIADHDPKAETEVLVRKDRIAAHVRITADRDLRVVIAGPVRKADRIAVHDPRDRTTPRDLRVEIKAIRTIGMNSVHRGMINVDRDPMVETEVHDPKAVKIAVQGGKVDRIADPVRKEQETRQRRSKKNLDVIKEAHPAGVGLFILCVISNPSDLNTCFFACTIRGTPHLLSL
jgi:hypothetical protein